MVDGTGKYLIPGLWDIHSHVVGYGPTALDLYLAHGVTGIRDMGAERFADAWPVIRCARARREGLPSDARSAS